MTFHQESKQETLSKLLTNEVNGLTSEDAKVRLEKNGPNKLDEKRRNLISLDF